jgi:SAM-dependent methyltransferase
MVNCHICLGNLKILPSFSKLFQVTSDCRSWKTNGNLAVCEKCFTVQKPKTKIWTIEANEIYEGYAIYSQGNGIEQSTFDANNGASIARSEKILNWLSESNIPLKGSLLDLGCGNGSFMKAFGNYYKNWEMTGLELDDKNKKIIENIPGVKKLHIGDIETLNDKFDLIVLIHALEHLTEPIEILKKLKSKLNPGGYVFIEVPDLEASPFDLLIADHCTHFTSGTLSAVVLNSGFIINKIVSNYVPKELSLLCTPNEDDISIEFQTDTNGERISINNIKFLNELLTKANSHKGNLAIFGSSISATWLATSLGDKISFFIDEDINRIGSKHMGKEILALNQVNENTTILMPLRSDIAETISRRLLENGHIFNIIY